MSLKRDRLAKGEAVKAKPWDVVTIRIWRGRNRYRWWWTITRDKNPYIFAQNTQPCTTRRDARDEAAQTLNRLGLVETK